MRRIKIFFPLAILVLAQEAFGDGHKESRGISGHENGHRHQDGGSYYNPAPTWSAWDYDWSKPEPYNPPPIDSRPSQPGNIYRPLYPENRLPPDSPNYPNTSLYLPTFILSVDNGMVTIGDEIKVTVIVKRGAPPYTVFWKYDDEPDWMSGTTTFTTKAEKSGLITIRAIVKDLNGQISQPQSIQVIVLSRS